MTFFYGFKQREAASEEKLMYLNVLKFKTTIQMKRQQMGKFALNL